jgi:hypothetical protein
VRVSSWGLKRKREWIGRYGVTSAYGNGSSHAGIRARSLCRIVDARRAKRCAVRSRGSVLGYHQRCACAVHKCTPHPTSSAGRKQTKKTAKPAWDSSRNWRGAQGPRRPPGSPRAGGLPRRLPGGKTPPQGAFAGFAGTPPGPLRNFAYRMHCPGTPARQLYQTLATGVLKLPLVNSFAYQ